jgi:hypothetical protein
MHKVSGECAGLILKEVRKADWAVGEADLWCTLNKGLGWSHRKLCDSLSLLWPRARPVYHLSAPLHMHTGLSLVASSPQGGRSLGWPTLFSQREFPEESVGCCQSSLTAEIRGWRALFLKGVVVAGIDDITACTTPSGENPVPSGGPPSAVGKLRAPYPCPRFYCSWSLIPHSRSSFSVNHLSHCAMIPTCFGCFISKLPKIQGLKTTSICYFSSVCISAGLFFSELPRTHSGSWKIDLGLLSCGGGLCFHVLFPPSFFVEWWSQSSN